MMRHDQKNCLFRDVNEIFLVDYLKKARTIRREYDWDLLVKLRSFYQWETNSNQTQKNHTSPGQCAAHTVVKTIVNIHYLGFKLVPHSIALYISGNNGGSGLFWRVYNNKSMFEGHAIRLTVFNYRIKLKLRGNVLFIFTIYCPIHNSKFFIAKSG